ncbi:PREDICTED: uncharacterized protein LOC106101800 [Papilio polytes]|uniref:uncharacterized protein LOC106101800 n=1 Tax=Papilio polytes TaxID=76194 RepID=UPI0006766D70|nr:PREDICTED: uncharacterized protein LOC106101800 [Papilio polytes]
MSRVNTITNKQWITKKHSEVYKAFYRDSHLRKSKFTKFTRWRRRRLTKWRLSTKVLIPLIILNVAGHTRAVEVTALTSRVLATFFGYPTTCNIGSEVKPCSLSLSCWLRGGTRLRGCGGSWLLTCCGPPDNVRTDGFDNIIPSSEWKYKVAPPTLRLVPHRHPVPANVFRRRADDDTTQVRGFYVTLQKRNN